jgi:hypothetical protein
MTGESGVRGASRKRQDLRVNCLPAFAAVLPAKSAHTSAGPAHRLLANWQHACMSEMLRSLS